MSATYSILEKKSNNDDYAVHASIAYSAEAYSSGLAVDKAKLGLPVVLQELLIESGTPGDANIYKYDASSEKIRIYEETAGSYAEVSGAQTVTVRVCAKGW